MRRKLRNRHNYTLIEILISMTILTVLVLLLLQFLAGTQQLWKINRTNIRIYENSRVAFEIIERDMRSCMTSEIQDKEIGFWINANHDPTDTSKSALCTFVSSVEHHEEANSRLCEVSYKFHTVTSAATTTLVPPAYTFARQMTCDTDTDNWNFTGRPANWMVNNNADDGTDATISNPQTFEEVINGIESFDIKYYDETDSLITPDASGDMTIPYRVEVNLVLFDESLTNQPAVVRFKSRRSFTKILYLGDLQTN